MSAFSDALAGRASTLGIDVPASAYAPFETYFRLLSRWNRTVNLTALPVDDLGDAALDRLLLEPVAAVPRLPPAGRDWVDLGTGGGSPAIPLKILRPDTRLAMIEARSRKVAFLREAVRELGLDHTTAEAVRFEALVDEAKWRGVADLVTARAVRPDETFLATVAHLLRPGGVLALFESAGAAAFTTPGLALTRSAQLIPGGKSLLSIYTKTI